MKVGIVVPYSWSYWGAVPEHAELQAAALQGQGIETRTVIGNDPPGSFTRVLHPRRGAEHRPQPAHRHAHEAGARARAVRRAAPARADDAHHLHGGDGLGALS